ncbi:MAG: ABC transporter permease [Candidatus Liptonbacteria bacterium]|nr:ABC transporter permease [Candidatus Liptonbacteria bacterium]
MRFRDALTTATAGVRHAKVRSALTMLGIVIGIASVIILMSIGRSAENLILDQVRSTGSNLIFVIPGATKGSRFASPASVQGVVIKTLVREDADNLRREPALSAVAPEVRGQARVVYENNDTTVTFEGVPEEFFRIRNFNLSRGYPFTNIDSDSLNRVTVIGSKLAETLFGQIDPVGKNLRIKNLSFRVVGVLEPKGMGPMGIDQDNVVLLPLLIAQKQILGIDHYNLMTIQGNEAYTMDYAKNRITSILREDHRITDPDKDDFTVRTQEDALDMLGNITGILTAFLTSIASISLIVGGIGIMNIMLVSVVERTKEIGLRKAVGATNWDILEQFLLESIILTLLGGVIGILVGAAFVGLAYLILSRTLVSGWTFALPASAIGLAALVSTLTGLAFGIYPASQAAKKNPIDALRYE